MKSEHLLDSLFFLKNIRIASYESYIIQINIQNVGKVVDFNFRTNSKIACHVRCVYLSTRIKCHLVEKILFKLYLYNNKEKLYMFVSKFYNEIMEV